MPDGTRSPNKAHDALPGSLACRFPLKRPIIRGCTTLFTAPRFLFFSLLGNEPENPETDKQKAANWLPFLYFLLLATGAYPFPACLSLKQRQIPWLAPYPCFRQRQEPTEEQNISQGAKNFFRSCCAEKLFALGPLTGRLWDGSVLLTKRQKIIPFGTFTARRTKTKGER